MPNLLVYIKRGIQRKIKVNHLKLKEIPDFLLVSPGGCGSATLGKYLEKYKKTFINLSHEFQICKRLVFNVKFVRFVHHFLYFEFSYFPFNFDQ